MNRLLESTDLQVGSALVVILTFIWLTWVNIKNARTSRSSTLTQIDYSFQVLGIIALFVTGWATYSFPFFLFALGTGRSLLDAFKFIFNPFFLLLGSLPPISSLVLKSKAIGSLIGGAVPFGILAMYLISNSIPQKQWLGPPLSYLVLGMIFGGTIGALTGPTTIKLINTLRLPLPFDFSPTSSTTRLFTSISHSPATPIEEAEVRHVFISHASEDKEEVARPLAEALKKRGLSIWFDEYELTLGDSLRRKIEDGLRVSRYGVVILSDNFFRKRWPQQELSALYALEVESKKILPVWHRLKETDVMHYAPLLADRLATSTDKGTNAVADEILRAVRTIHDQTSHGKR